MKYSLTNDLRTGNSTIDTQHDKLFCIINDLFDACAKGHGRENIGKTAQFLQEYVGKHFSDEEKLQLSANYPGYKAHKQFHENYKEKLKQRLADLNENSASITSLANVNTSIAELIAHIKTEDKKIAQHLQTLK